MLPDPNSPWPPPGLEKPYDDIQAWSAWWGGDPEVLSAVYGGARTTTEHSWTQRGGLVGALQRWFWGQPPRPGEQRTKLHVPVAAEIAQVSADLLFGQPPKITVGDDATQEVIDRLLGEAVHTLLHESAEAGAALGHSWLRVGIDKTVDPDGPIISHVDADAAYPTYRYGRLHDVTFLSEFAEDGGTYWRHLEHHARGSVEHGLYRGDVRNLGRMMPLEDHHVTEPLARFIQQLPDGRQGIATGLTDQLDVVGVSNGRSRTWRHIPAGKDMGRADISGVELELDALDDAWSSWMRDLRHGRSRIHVPQSYLRSQGPGKGATADLDEEVYVGMNAMPGSEGIELTATQFKIRYQEHEATTLALLERIFSGAGYSPQTFGMADTAAITAMESWNRQVRTQNTRSAKIRRWRQGLLQLVRLVLEYDRLHFNGHGRPDVPPEVQFQETVAESQQARAQTAQLLSAARAASRKTLVKMQHPDWDETQVDDEVKLIGDENAVNVQDPLDAFGDLEDTPADDEQDPAAEPDEEPDDEDEAPAGQPQTRRRRTRPRADR